MSLNRIFWGNVSNGDVYSSPETIPSGQTAVNRDDIDIIVPSGNPVSDQSRSFHFNNTTRQLFWTDDGVGQIIKSNPDGSSVTVIASGLGTGIRDLTIHEGSGHIYFTDITADNITRMNLDGSNQTIVATGVMNAWGIAFEEISETLFWTELNSGRIVSSGIGDAFVSVLRTVTIPLGIAIDNINDRLYWVELTTNKLNRTSLDGALATQEVFAGGNNLTHCSIDIVGQKLYLTEQTSPKTIRKIDLDIVGENDVISDWVGQGTGAQNGVFGIAFGTVGSSVNSNTPLFINGIIDILNTNTPLFISGFASTIQNNSPLFIKGPVVVNQNTPLFIKTPNSFFRKLYFADLGVDKIQRSELNIPEGETSANRTDIEIIVDEGGPTVTEFLGIAFDKPTQTLFYADFEGNGGSGIIVKSDPLGNNKTTIVTNANKAEGLAIDSTNKFVYWVNRNTDLLERVDFDGNGRTTILSGLSNPVRLTVHEPSGLLFFSELGLLGDPNDSTIKEFNLATSGVVTIASELNTTGVVVDPVNDKIYFADTEANTVESMNLDGSSRTQLFTEPGDLDDITLDIQNQVLYVTNLNTSVIKRIDLTPSIVATDFITVPGALNFPRGLAIGDISVDALNVNTPMFLKVPQPATSHIPLFLKIPDLDFDWTFEDFVSVDGFVPNIIGNLEGSTGPVTIQVWENTSSGPVLLSLASDVCTQIGSTGRWGWLTSNLPSTSNTEPSYVFTMTPTVGSVIFGEFRLRKSRQAGSIGTLGDSLGTIL